MRAPQAQRGRGHRRDQLVQALVALHEAPADGRGADDHDGGDADDLHLAAAHRAEQAPADDDEQDDEHGDVQQPLGQQRADDGALRRLRARRHQDDADGVAGAGGQHVVAHVADDGERVGVRAGRVRAFVHEQPLPALGAHDRGQGVERDRAEQRGDLGGGVRQLRRLLLGRPPHDEPDPDDRDDDPDQRQGRAAPGPGDRRRGDDERMLRGGRFRAHGGAPRIGGARTSGGWAGSQVNPISRARATAAAGPSVHGSPWPNSSNPASTRSSASSEASICWLSCGERARHQLRAAACRGAGCRCTARRRRSAPRGRAGGTPRGRGSGRAWGSPAGGRARRGRRRVNGVTSVTFGVRAAPSRPPTSEHPPDRRAPTGTGPGCPRACGSCPCAPSRRRPACTCTGAPASRRTLSDIPTWSECAWVRITASIAETLRAARAQVLVELRAEPGEAAVHQRHPVAVLDQVAVDDGVAEAVDAGRELGGSVGHGLAALQGSNPFEGWTSPARGCTLLGTWRVTPPRRTT